MRSVLLIGEIWPYHRGAGNCVHAVARHMPEFGWDPVVLTTPLTDVQSLPYEVVQVPYRDSVRAVARGLGFQTDRSLKKQVVAGLGVGSRRSAIDVLFGLGNEVLTYPDRLHGWRRPALAAAQRLVQEHNVEAIVTDNPPVSAQLVARELKQVEGIPWLVYFSHLWSNNNGYAYGRLRQRLDSRLELRTMAVADAMVTHSAPLAEKLRELHQGARISWTHEGYDPETLNVPARPLTTRFTVTYTGSFAPDLREPRTLLEALSGLLSRGVLDPRRVEVRFYGPKETWVDAQISGLGLETVACQHGRVSFEEAIAAQRESQVLYNPKWNDPSEPGIYSGKIFEYLAALRPILATGDHRDVVDGLLSETGAGFAARTVEEAQRLLLERYREYEETGAVSFKGDVEKIRCYSHRGLARHVAGELDDLVRQRRNS